jgi:hypothetical protein
MFVSMIYSIIGTNVLLGAATKKNDSSRRRRRRRISFRAKREGEPFVISKLVEIDLCLPTGSISRSN